MPEGSNTYKGLAVPLYGQFEIKQSTAATDIATLTAITGATGDFLVAQTAGGGEVFVVDDAGDVSLRRLIVGTVNSPTTAPTTGLTKGEMFLVWKSATCPTLGMCVSAATQLVLYTMSFSTHTLGLKSAGSP